MKRANTKIAGLYSTYLQYDKVRFVIVGGVGFIVNFLGLALFFAALNIPILFAQILSAELAILATFLGNNFWAFRGHDHIPFLRKLWRFHASAITGIAINSAIVIVLVQVFGVYYGLALAIGSLLALVWNYTLYKRFVFKAHPRNDSE